MIAGVAWIGTAFYFNRLEAWLAAVASPNDGAAGEVWTVHGGTFYTSAKRAAPDPLPAELHWFKWEAYLTWISGAALLILIYYLGAEVYLLDPRAAATTPAAAIAIGAASLLLGWSLYEALCRTWLAARPLPFGLLGLVLALALSYGLARTLGGRAAYLHVGATLGTIMAANVFLVIIPAQKKLTRALERGVEPDRALAVRAAARSLHNNYLALPVLFTMISSHYPMTYGHRYGWLILGGLFLVGVLTRHGLNRRSRGRRYGWTVAAAVLGLSAVTWVSASARGPSRPAASSEDGAPVSFSEAREILVARCVSCHSARPAQRLFDSAPGGVTFDTPEQIGRWADRIYAVAVDTHVMPLGNITGMTGEERARLGRWVEAGARLE